MSQDNKDSGNLSAIMDLSRLMGTGGGLTFALDSILLTCLGKLLTTKGLIALYSEGLLSVKASKGLKPDQISSFPELPTDEASFQNFSSISGLKLYAALPGSAGPLGYIFMGPRISGCYDEDDLSFLSTVANIGGQAIENVLIAEDLRSSNRELDGKIERLKLLFDLSREFSSLVSMEEITKLLLYSIIGQMLVTKYAVVLIREGKNELLQARLPGGISEDQILSQDYAGLHKILQADGLKAAYPLISAAGFIMLVPMRSKNGTIGFILLGKRAAGKLFSPQDVEFLYSITGLAAISISNLLLFQEFIKKEKLEKDIALARSIQQSLFPSEVPLLNGFELAALNEPARQVGGDYYDIIRLNEEEVLLAIGDVSGKGVPASLLMANLQAFLKSVFKTRADLKTAIELINSLICENTAMGNFITFFACILNERTSTIEYINAGHNPPVLLHEGEIRSLGIGGMILGVLPDVKYESGKETLCPGDTVLLYTDGITEAMNKFGQEYSELRLMDILKLNCNLAAKDILDSVIRDVAEHVKGFSQSDDLTMLLIKANAKA